MSVTCDKTDHHDITEILLKVALNTINQPAWKKYKQITCDSFFLYYFLNNRMRDLRQNNYFIASFIALWSINYSSLNCVNLKITKIMKTLAYSIVWKLLKILLYLISKDISFSLTSSHVFFAYISISVLSRGETSVDTVDVFFLCANHKAKDKFMWQNGHRPNTKDLYNRFMS